MAKLSVYVPDDLLARARLAEPTIRPSQVLQDALEARVSGGPRPFATISEALREQRARAQEIVNRRATEAYQEGYAVGLRVATSLPWRAFEVFAQLHWNLEAWVSSFADEEYDFMDASPEEIAAGQIVLDFAGMMEAVAAENSGDIPLRAEDSCPTGISAEGFVDAIRDVWTGTPADTVPPTLFPLTVVSDGPEG